MIVKLAGPGRRPRKCTQCDRAIREGQPILEQRINDVSFNVSTIFFHVSCVALLVKDAPASQEVNCTRRTWAEMEHGIRSGDIFTG